MKYESHNDYLNRQREHGVETYCNRYPGCCVVWKMKTSLNDILFTCKIITLPYMEYNLNSKQTYSIDVNGLFHIAKTKTLQF